MSVLVAALVLAWICIVLLSLGLAGLLWQVRNLQNDLMLVGAQGTRRLTGRRIPQFAGSSPLAVLVMDPGCGACGPMLEAFGDLAATPGRRYEALSRIAAPDWADTPGVTVRVDDDLFRGLDVPWLPSLLLVDPDGVIAHVGPVNSPDELAAALAAGAIAPTPAAEPALRS